MGRIHQIDDLGMFLYGHAADALAEESFVASMSISEEVRYLHMITYLLETCLFTSTRSSSDTFEVSTSSIVLDLSCPQQPYHLHNIFYSPLSLSRQTYSSSS